MAKWRTYNAALRRLYGAVLCIGPPFRCNTQPGDASTQPRSELRTRCSGQGVETDPTGSSARG